MARKCPVQERGDLLTLDESQIRLDVMVAASIAAILLAKIAEQRTGPGPGTIRCPRCGSQDAEYWRDEKGSRINVRCGRPAADESGEESICLFTRQGS